MLPSGPAKPPQTTGRGWSCAEWPVPFVKHVGEINYPFLFDELGYSGWIGCEYRPKGETRAGLG
jgi:hypothetical protein